MSEIVNSSRFVRACQIIAALGILNLLLFVSGAVYLGGDAVNGKIDGGRYYVFGVRAEAGRKIYTEVSRSVFLYSKSHAYSVLISWPFVMAAAFVLSRTQKQRGGT